MPKSFSTRYCRYGAQHNVRKSYEQLPCQWFWTWLTGKGLALPDLSAKQAARPGSMTRLLMHLAFTWTVMGVAIALGSLALADSFGWAGNLICLAAGWILVINRARSLQATYHYMTHGSVIADMKAAKYVATMLITTPMLYDGWESYVHSHVREHHHLRNLCSERDPDERYIGSLGFRLGMSPREYWLRVWFSSFRPSYLLNLWSNMVRENFIKPGNVETLFRVTFWTVLVSVCTYFGVIEELIVLYLFPLLFLFPHSMWLQLFTEHLWFSRRVEGVSEVLHYGTLTWGRFQGRDVPEDGFLRKITWAVKCAVCDIPVRLYVYPQDLPNHDFHHRYPLANYWNIENFRSSTEGQANRFGPQYEVWGFMSTLRMMRDHFCHGISDPFNITSAFLADQQGSMKMQEVANQMRHEVSKVAKENLQTKAYAHLPAAELFSEEQIRFLSEACRDVPKSMIRVGDVGEYNNLDVGRFMEDKKGELPVYRNDPLGKDVVNILDSERSRAFFSEIMDGDYYIRRCQANVMCEGGFIGKHIDTYSNLDYKYSVVIQFGEHYEGGEFFVEYENEEHTIKTRYADLLVNRCEIPHGVREVTGGKRTSLVFFLSKNSLGVPNLHNKQI